MYGATKVEYTEEAKKQLDEFIALGHGNGVICIAKTPNSLTEDPKIVGRPEGFTIHIRECLLMRLRNWQAKKALKTLKMQPVNS